MRLGVLPPVAPLGLVTGDDFRTERALPWNGVGLLGGFLNCPKCGTALPEGAAFCSSCGAPVSPPDRVVADVTRATKSALGATAAVLDRAAKAVKPVVDTTVTALRTVASEGVKVAKPAAKEVAKATKEVARSAKPIAETTVRVTKEAVGKAANLTEKTAREVKEKVRRRPPS